MPAILREPMGKGYTGLFPLARPETLRKDWKWYALLGAFVGLAAFLCIYGWRVLDVTYDAWLLERGGDLTQHYLGWKFFRASPWQFPLGLTDAMTYPYEVSITYTDSIPLFAFFFKLLSPLLPTTFQYFGLWGLCTFVLGGAFSALLVRSVTANYVSCGVGALLLTVTPTVFTRMFNHTALAGHFLFIAALLYWVYGAKLQAFGKNLAFWCGLMFLCGWVHPYFFPMVGAFLFGYLVHNCAATHSFAKQAVLLVTALLAGVCSLGLTGAFQGDVSPEYGGLGEFSLNLNGFYNPIYQHMSRFVQGRPLLVRTQTEGLAYLGLGGLLMLLAGFALLAVFFALHTKKNGGKAAAKAIPWGMLWLLAAFVPLVVAALSPIVTLHGRVLFEIPYPSFVLSLLRVFRATGRFAMPAAYILLFVAIWLVCRYARRLAPATLAALTVLQMVDISAVFALQRDIGRYTEATPTAYEEVWDWMEGDIKHIVYDAANSGAAELYTVANVAVEHGMTTSNFYLARPHPQAGQTFKAAVEQLLAGELPNDTALVCLDGGTARLLAWLGGEDVFVYDLDGYWLALPVPLPAGYAPRRVAESETLPVMEAFALPHTGAFDGDTGIYSLSPGELVFGPYIYLPAGNYIVTFEGENLGEAAFFAGVSGAEGIEAENTVLESTDEKAVVLLQLYQSVWDIEFTVTAVGSVTVSLGAITLEHAV